MSECNLYGRNRPDMYLFTHEQILSTVNEAYSYGEHGIDTADFRIKCEDFGTNFVLERTCRMKDNFDSIVCSACGEVMFDTAIRNYCPNCGAKVVE